MLATSRELHVKVTVGRPGAIQKSNKNTYLFFYISFKFLRDRCYRGFEEQAVGDEMTIRDAK